MVVHFHLVEGQACDPGGSPLGARDDLRARPDLAAVRAQADRAVHRLHRRVREEGNLVHRFELVRRSRENRRRVPLVSHDHARRLRGGGEPLDDIGGVDLSVLSVVPANVERRQSLLGRPHVICHDGNRVVEADNLAHSFDCPGLGVIDADQLAADYWTRSDRGDLHSGQSHVDAVLGFAVHLCRSIESLGGGADQFEILRVLQSNLRRHRQLRGFIGQRAVRQLAAGRRVGDDSSARPTRRRVHAPGLGGSGHQHGAHGRTGAAKRLVERSHRGRRARFLIAEHRVRVQLVVGRRVLEVDLVQSHLQFSRDQHGHRGVGALSHFDLVHDQRDPAVLADANKRVRREVGLSPFGRCCQHARQRLEMQPQQESTAGGRARKKELATRHLAHSQPSFLAVAGLRAARLMASRMRG